MTQHVRVSVKLFNSQLGKLKFQKKTWVSFRLFSNTVGDFNNETNFTRKCLPTDKKFPKFRKAFATNSSVDIKLS